MWNSVGRSGHHIQYVGNGYDEWEGLSPNGRQVKNQLTDEVRNLSGADYWHMRKSSVIEVKPAKKPKAKRTAFESICLADSHYNRLERQMKALQQQFDDGELSWDDFMYAHKLQSERMEKAWRRVCKARNWSEQDDSEPLAQYEEPIENPHYTNYNESPIVSSTAQEIFSSLSDGNVFKIAYMKIKRIAEALK